MLPTTRRNEVRSHVSKEPVHVAIGPELEAWSAPRPSGESVICRLSPNTNALLAQLGTPTQSLVRAPLIGDCKLQRTASIMSMLAKASITMCWMGSYFPTSAPFIHGQAKVDAFYVFL